jgi:hypothetical protein
VIPDPETISYQVRDYDYSGGIAAYKAMDGKSTGRGVSRPSLRGHRHGSMCCPACKAVPGCDNGKPARRPFLAVAVTLCVTIDLDWPAE